MSTWADVFLGIIAVATLAMAIVQIGVIVAAGRLARRVDTLAKQIEREVQPLFGHLNAIGRDASRAAALATAQVERADKLFAEVAVRVEQALDNVQETLGAPAREGRAFLSALKAASIIPPGQTILRNRPAFFCNKPTKESSLLGELRVALRRFAITSCANVNLAKCISRTYASFLHSYEETKQYVPHNSPSNLSDCPGFRPVCFGRRPGVPAFITTA